MSRTTTEEMSSDEARGQILAQHAVLRRLLADVVASADQTAASGEDFEVLRERAKLLYETLAVHMTFEEELLPAALRDVIGCGAMIRAGLQEDHARQREIIALAISGIGPNGFSGAALIESVQAFVEMLLVDMESEERCLLQADLDALSNDSHGG
jgi:hemerythrin HHE cation binding domain-containing protein